MKTLPNPLACLLLAASSVAIGFITGCSNHSAQSRLESALDELEKGSDTSSVIIGIINNCSINDDRQSLMTFAENALIDDLSSANPVIRRGAVNALGSIGSTHAVEPMFKISYSDPDAKARERAQSMLQCMIIKGAGPARDFIKNKLESTSTDERAQAQILYQCFEQHFISLATNTPVHTFDNLLPNESLANPSDLRQAKEMQKNLPSACNRSYITVSSDGTVNIRVLCSNSNNQTDMVISIKDGKVSGLDGGTFIGR